MSDDRLYHLHAEATKEFESGPKFNWVLRFDCAAQDLRNLEITDVREDAAGWRSRVPPKNFYFTHAQFYTDGIQHIIDELLIKPTSNRALYSLISQEHIRKKGDAPIPSFMTFQCQIDNDALYCTCYFRALEISTFLKINLEEIRQTLVEIYEGVPRFSKVNLTIFAFHAYIDRTRSPLKRPQLESLYELDLASMLSEATHTPVRNLNGILKELRNAGTVVSAEKLIDLKRILSTNLPGIKIHPDLTKALFIEQLGVAIEAATTLGELRCKESRGPAVTAATSVYQTAIDAMLNTLDT